MSDLVGHGAVSAPLVEQVVAELVADGRELGVAVAAHLHGELVVDCWGGTADERDGRPVDGDTLFNVYSVTKAVAATALHILAERGLVDYDARVADYWPEYGSHGKEATTVRHVLTHRAGVPQMPEGVTPELMTDVEWVQRGIADLTPLAPPGERAMYLAMTFGWIVAAIVTRADPQHRSLARFVREEIAEPLDAPDLWIGVPDSEWPRVAHMVDAAGPMPSDALPPLYERSLPPAVGLVPAVFGRPDVARAEVGGVGGIFTARSCARFWAMLAGGGQLDGVRLLSEERVRSFAEPRENATEPDTVMFDMVLPLGGGGFWLGGQQPPVAAAGHPGTICHPGAGNSIGFADLDSGLSLAFCHNRMQIPAGREEDTSALVADAVRAHLGLT